MNNPCPDCNQPWLPSQQAMRSEQYQEALARLAECEGITDAQRAARLAYIQSAQRESEDAHDPA